MKPYIYADASPIAFRSKKRAQATLDYHIEERDRRRYRIHKRGSRYFIQYGKPNYADETLAPLFRQYKELRAAKVRAEYDRPPYTAPKELSDAYYAVVFKLEDLGIDTLDINVMEVQ